MKLRSGAVIALTLVSWSCAEPAKPTPSVPAPIDTSPTPTPEAPAKATPKIAPSPPPGTRATLSDRKNDDSWGKMLVAGGRLWTLTELNHWTSGPMYVPAARLWSVPIGGGELTRHLDLEGYASLAADDTSLYVAVNRDLSTMNTDRAKAATGRIFRVPLTGGAPVDLATGLAPSLLAVDGDTLWFDGQRMPKDGSKAPAPSGVKGPLAFAFDDESVYFTSGRNPGEPAKPDGKNGRVLRISKKGGPATVLASDLPDEPSGLAVDASHVYVTAVSWKPAGAERGGVIARIPKSGGALEILAKDQPSVRAAWLSGDYFFFLSGRSGRPGAVLRVSKSGGAVESVVTDSTLAYATVDATSVYFSSDGTFRAEPFQRLSPATLVRFFK